MKGQWIGEYTGSNKGQIIVNVDEVRSCFEGIAYLIDRDETLPHTAVTFKTNSKDRQFTIRTLLIQPINPRTAVADLWDNVKGFYQPTITIPDYADIEGTWDDQYLTLTWKTNLGTEGQCKLAKSRAGQPSELHPLEHDWKAYKEYVSNLETRRYLFRGQSRPWRLRTSFHRTGRANFVKFLNEDIQALHKHLSATTRHVFNLEIPNENGAFFNLVQHHGYPTPLLDWTYSPYVAAFFAYRDISNKAAREAVEEDKVRILVLDHVEWRADFSQVLQFLHPGIHVSIGEFLAIENQRMIPQQAASTITNVDDIETYIRSKELETQKTYLSAIDLPVQQRKAVMQELSHMGITAGSLFPGLDGACEELKERYFES
jgi:hypothetical protein